MPSKGEFEIESKEKQWEERKIRMHEEQWNEMYEALKSYKERVRFSFHDVHTRYSIYPSHYFS